MCRDVARARRARRLGLPDPPAGAGARFPQGPGRGRRPDLPEARTSLGAVPGLRRAFVRLSLDARYDSWSWTAGHDRATDHSPLRPPWADLDRHPTYSRSSRSLSRLSATQLRTRRMTRCSKGCGYFVSNLHASMNLVRVPAESNSKRMTSFRIVGDGRHLNEPSCAELGDRAAHRVPPQGPMDGPGTIHHAAIRTVPASKLNGALPTVRSCRHTRHLPGSQNGSTFGRRGMCHSTLGRTGVDDGDVYLDDEPQSGL